MSRRIGNTKRIGYAVSKRNQNKMIPLLCGSAVFVLGMLAGKLEVMTFVGAFAWASVVPQWLGKMLYSGVVLPVSVPGYFGFGIMQYLDWNRLVLITVSSVLWGGIFWFVAMIKRR